MSSPKVLVVGAGISGLTIARQLQAAGNEVIILESEPHPGGAIQTVRENGFLCEAGPNSMLVKAPLVADFLKEIGLGDRITPANEEAKKRFIVRGGRPVAVPMSPLQAVTTPLFSFGAKLRFLGEPFRAAHPQDDETVASFVSRRMGPEFLEYAIGPMTSGIYAGNPEALSIRHAFPKVWALERSGGSLIRGTLKLRKERKARGETPFKSQLISFKDGIGELTDHLARSLSPAVHYGCSVRSFARQPDGDWQVRWTRGEAQQEGTFTQVVLTPGPNLWSRWELPDTFRATLDTLPLPEYPPVSTLVLGFKREDVAHPLDGFGVLIPHSEGFPFLGCIFSSTLFPDRAPPGHVSIMLFLGGAVTPEAGLWNATEAIGNSMEGLQRLLGVSGDPVFSRHVHWPQAIPQYTMTHGRFAAGLEALEDAHPGLHLQGNYRGGPGLSDCIQNAIGCAAKILDS